MISWGASRLVQWPQAVRRASGCLRVQLFNGYRDMIELESSRAIHGWGVTMLLFCGCHIWWLAGPGDERWYRSTTNTLWYLCVAGLYMRRNPLLRGQKTPYYFRAVFIRSKHRETCCLLPTNVDVTWEGRLHARDSGAILHKNLIPAVSTMDVR